VKAVFQRLTDNSLLEKCLHGKTQHQDEALNTVIWQIIPKEVFVHRDSLEIGVYDAVLHFNIGCDAIVELFKSMNIPAGKYTEFACHTEDKSYVSLAQYKSMPKDKEKGGQESKRKRQQPRSRGTKIWRGICSCETW
jgi:hypothetical protein